MLPLLRYWPYMAAFLAVTALLGGTYAKGRANGVRAAEARCEAKFAQAEEKAMLAIREAEERYMEEHRQRLELLEAARTLPDPPPPRTLIREVPVDAPVLTCPKLSSTFRVSFNADPAATGTPATELVSE